MCPNYYDVDEWKFAEYPDKIKISYLGRTCQIKGLDIFVEIAKRFPDIDFIMCGQGDEQPFMNRSKNIKYLPPLHGKARSDYLSELTAVICPSLYVEPFLRCQCGSPIMWCTCYSI